MNFLEKIALKYLESAGNDLSDHVFIFPNRRAGVFFNRILAKHTGKPVWAPETYSIFDFVQKQTSLQVPERLILLFELHQVYQHYMPEETFENFIAWGNMLLNDFDEIDKFLINPDSLFTEILEMKKIDEKFSIDAIDMEAFQTFLENTGTVHELPENSNTDAGSDAGSDTNENYNADVNANSDSKIISDSNANSDENKEDLKKQFFKFWRIAGKLYKDFNLRLSQNNMAYEGKLYKSLANSNDSIKVESDKKYIFAGFNAMNPAEAAIINKMNAKGNVHIYWHADSYYFDDKEQEAGHFIRKSTAFFSKEIQTLWVDNKLKEAKKNIHIYPLPARSLQAVIAGDIIEKMIYRYSDFQQVNNEEESGIDTAVILPDEHLLFPLLNSIPAEVRNFNVTMGFPVSQSPVFSFFSILHQMHKFARLKENQVYFKSSVLLDLIDHPYIRIGENSQIKELKNSILSKNMNFINEKKIENSEANIVLKKSLFYSTTPKAILQYLEEVIAGLLSIIEEERTTDRIIISQVHVQIRLLNELFQKYDVNISLESTWQVILKLLKTVKVAFTGEPLKGLQIMGLLETRCLDFKNLIIMSMNEKFIPASNRQHSYIPYNLRKAYNLPVFDEQEAIAAYHFYRLIQLADDIHLIYVNSGADQDHDEVSRYILQCNLELKKINPAINFNEVNFQVSRLQFDKKKISIYKNADILDKLKLYCIEGIEGKKLYPTALTQFVRCPVSFYYIYVLGIRESNDLPEFLDARIFGQVLHDAMESLYKPFTGNVIDKKILQELRAEIQNHVDNALQQSFPDALSNRSGKNYLLRNVIIRLIQKILEQDQNDAPFKIIALENTGKDAAVSLVTPVEITISTGKTTVYLNGKADRIDEVDGIVRVIDYKSGKVDFKKKFDISELFTDPALNALLQTYLYTYMYKKNYPGSRVKAGIFAMSRLNEGIAFISEEPVSDEELNIFENELKKFLSQIFDPEIPFEQADVERLDEMNTVNVVPRA